MKVTQVYWDFYPRYKNKTLVHSLHSRSMKTNCVRSAHIKNNLNSLGLAELTACRVSLRTSLTNFSCLTCVLPCHFLQALNASSLAEHLCLPLFFPHRFWISCSKQFARGRCVQRICISADFSTNWIWMARKFRWRHFAAETDYLLNKTEHWHVGASIKHLMNFRSPVDFLIRLQNSETDYFHFREQKKKPL